MLAAVYHGQIDSRTQRFANRAPCEFASESLIVSGLCRDPRSIDDRAVERPSTPPTSPETAANHFTVMLGGLRNVCKMTQ